MGKTVTYFVVQPFEQTKKGKMGASSPIQATSSDHAKRLAMRYSGEGKGAIAFSRSGDPTLGEYGDAVILAIVGTVPDGAMESAA
jgi:hypothetical protein